MLEGRIDAVVLSVDSAQRENKIEIVTGVTDANPVRPVIPNSETKHCYPLAYVTIDAEAETITNDKIQNVVGLTPTPYVTGILQTANVDNLYSSWEDRFNTWFEGVQTTLDGDTVGNLLNEINSVKNELKDKEDKISLPNETLIFTESVDKVFINPHAKKILVTCVGPGGNGFSLKTATIIPSISNLIFTSIVNSSEQNGTNTLLTNAEFKGEGLAGSYENIDRVDYHGTGSYYNYTQNNSFSLSAGTGGGGYGGNGGDYEYEYELEDGYDSSYINQALVEAKKNFCAGTGGGGYGGNGGLYKIKATIRSNSFNVYFPNFGGTGGGGYGGNGGSLTGGTTICGRGGGGYGPDNYGGGGDGATYTSGGTSLGSPGKLGMVIVQLIYDEEE